MVAVDGAKSSVRMTCASSAPRVHAHVRRRSLACGVLRSTPALVEEHDPVAVRIEIAAISSAGTRTRAAMNDQCRLAAGITARLPVDVVAVAYVEKAMCVRFDWWIRLHTNEVTPQSRPARRRL
jgi:hypothetical protein